MAGLSAAIQAAKHGSVLVVTKEKVDENNTAYAQGGIAVVLSERDTLIKHVKDTLDAGQELCDKTTVKTIISEGPKRVREMIDWGAAFDRQNNHLIFTQEGGHSFPPYYPCPGRFNRQRSGTYTYQCFGKKQKYQGL